MGIIQGNSTIRSSVIMTANQATTSNTATNLTELVFTTQPNSRYTVSGQFHVGCNNTGGVKFAATVPSGATFFVSLFGQTTSAALFDEEIISVSGTLSGTAHVQRNTNSATVKVYGEFTTASTGGAVQFQFASGTNTESSTIFVKGTFLRIEKIA